MDIRVTNTQNRIQAGLISCIQSKSLIELHDKEIIEEAQVSSRTFYKYYADKNDVLDEVEKIIFDDYRKAILKDIKYWQDLTHSPSKKDIMSLSAKGLDNVLDCFKKHRTSIKALTSDNGDSKFNNQLTKILKEYIKKLVIHYFGIYNQQGRILDQEIPFNLVAIRFAQSVISPLKYWLENEDYISPQQIKQMIGKSVLYSSYDLTAHSLGK